MAVEDFLEIEFGLSYINESEQQIVRIPIDGEVKQILDEMRTEFYKSYNSFEGEASVFETSEKYASSEKLFIPLDDELVTDLRELYNTDSIPISTVALRDLLDSVKFYFAIFTSNDSSKQIAIKRPSQFKALLGKRIIRLTDDTLTRFSNDLFKLDNDFDFILNQQNIEILHPVGFDYIANIDEEVLRSAAEATRQLATRLPFIDFVYLANYVGTSKTAAKLIRSIKKRDDLERTSQLKLLSKCQILGVNVTEENGHIIPDETGIIRFLEILDRRGYDFDILEDDTVEIYVASSRRRVN